MIITKGVEMIEKLYLNKLSKEEKKLLLQALNYDSDDTFVLDKDRKPILDPYIQKPVTLNNMVIFPGSTIILDNNPLSITAYLEDHPNVRLF